jgi:hypothetical protein
MRPTQTNVTLTGVMLDRSDLAANPHVRRYGDVFRALGRQLDQWIDFFNDPRRQQRLIDAEIHHRRPALAGIVVELEAHPAFRRIAAANRDATRRYRQTIGVIVKLIMAGLGWEPAGRKGFLGGGRSKGLSRYFGRAEHYRRVHASAPNPQA